MNKSLPKRSITFFDIIYTVIAFIYSYSYLNCELDETYTVSIGLLCLSGLIWCAISNKHMYNTYFSLLFFLECAYVVFLMGQSVLEPFADRLSANQYKREPVQDVNIAYIYNYLCLIFMHWGVIMYRFIHIKNGYKLKAKEKVLNTDYTKYIIIVGKVVFFATIVPYIYVNYKLLTGFAELGYSGVYDSTFGNRTSWSKLFYVLADYVPYSLFLLLVGYKKGKRASVVKILIGICILLNFVVGNRSEPISYSIALLWIQLEFSDTKLERSRAKMTLVLVALVLLVISPIIGANRNTNDYHFSMFESNLGKNGIVSTIIESVSTMGYSVFPTIKTMQLIPKQFGYRLGQSYVYAILSIVPNVIGGTHVSVKYASLAGWLKTTLNMNYGPGFSIPAEVYYNFGWYGMLFMPIYGYVFSKVFDLDDPNKNKDLGLFLAIGSFICLFSIFRRDTMTAIHDVVYLVLFLYIIVLSSLNIDEAYFMSMKHK